MTITCYYFLIMLINSLLQELETDGVDPSLFTSEASNVLRPDEGAPSLPNEVALRPAPDSEPPYFLVPRIIGDAESSES